MKTRSLMSSDQAVSESLGYILIFGVIMACIALIYVNGSQIINDAQESTSFQGMEQSFLVIGSDLKKTAYGESPVMTSRINVDYGTLSYFPPGDSGSRLVIYNTSNPADGFIYNRPLGNITFSSVSWGKSICIEDGAVVKMYGGSGDFGSVMTTEPRIYYSRNTRTLMISVINMSNFDPTLVSVGSGIATIQSKYNYTTVEPMDVNSNNVTICMQTVYTGAWKDFLANGITGLDNDDIYSWASSSTWANASLHGPTGPPGENIPIEHIIVVTYYVDVKLT